MQNPPCSHWISETSRIKCTKILFYLFLGRVNLSGMWREDCVLRFLENKMLRKIFGVKVRREEDAKEKVK